MKEPKQNGNGKAICLPFPLLNCVWLFVTAWIIALRGSSIHGLLQVKILEWVAIPFSSGSS